MGSALGMKHAVGGTVILPNRYPDFLAWMPGADECVIYEEQPDEAKRLIAEADYIICTDFNDPSRIGGLGELIPATPAPENGIGQNEQMLVIDHHPPFPASPSASLEVYRWLRAQGYTINHDCAECLYTGMMTDTGNFSFNSKSPEQYRVIADLLELGIDKDAIYDRVFNTHTEDRMRLVGYCLYNKMRLLRKDVALISLSRREQYRFNFRSGDAEGIVNMPMEILEVKYSVMMREDALTDDEKAAHPGVKSKVKISFRSQGDRPVNVLARNLYQGGGHANASGGTYYGPLKEAIELFEAHYEEYYK